VSDSSRIVRAPREGGTPLSASAPKSSPGLGDVVAKALSAVGVTKERVESWLGRPCGCRERQRKLNALGEWAKAVLSGHTERANEHLSGIMGDPTSSPVPPTK
jgi:hypothetical protein